MAQLSKKKAQQLLKDLVKGLNQDGPNAAALWAILSALRGPDESTNHTKAVTTERIRGAIGIDPRVGLGQLGPAVTSEPLDQEALKWKNEQVDENRFYHFFSHYKGAVAGIKYFLNYDLKTETKLKDGPEEFGEGETF